MNSESVKLECARLLLKPVVRFCVRHGLSVQQMIELLKQTVIRVAGEQLEAQGEKLNISRLSAMTGMHRRDVQRVTTEPELKPLPAPLAARVIAQWENGSQFCDSRNRPRRLRLDPGKNEFLQLIATVNTDLNPGTILFELERSGLVECKGSFLHLRQRHVPTRRDAVESFAVAAADTDDLISAVENNVTEEPVRLHARTEFDRIPAKHAERLREWILAEGGKFHSKVRRRLADYDLDLSPQPDGESADVVSISLTSFCNLKFPAERSAQ